MLDFQFDFASKHTYCLTVFSSPGCPAVSTERSRNSSRSHVPSITIVSLGLSNSKGKRQGAWRVPHWNFGKPQPLSRSPEKPWTRMQSLDRRASSYTTVSGQSRGSCLLTLLMTNCRLVYWIITTNSIHGNTCCRTSHRSVLPCVLASLCYAIVQHTLLLGPAVHLLRHIHAVNALKLGSAISEDCL